MDSLIDRLKRSVAQRGWAETAQLCAYEIQYRVSPRLRRLEAERQAADDAFDRRYKVDTGGIVRPRKESVVGDHWELGGNYQAVDPQRFLAALRLVQIRHEDFTFIDFGSGKGRTLLLASTFPFKHVVGVEYCTQLNDVARANVKRFPESERLCSSCEIVDGDAAQYALPSGPLLLFLNNPFAEPVMARVIQNVVESYWREPRRIIVIYLIPNLAHLWESTGFLRKVGSDPAIFDSAPESKPVTQSEKLAARVV